VKHADFASVRPSKSFARSVTVTALSVVVAMGAGCYETTPHRVEVASSAAASSCAATVASVFAGAGFVQLPAPAHTSMFFGPRMTGAYSSLLRSGSGVGVTMVNDAAAGQCRLTLEALSADASCPGSELNPGGPPLLCPPLFEGPSGQGTVSGPSHCRPPPPEICELSSAPGPDNDAAVDELARRLRVALGPKNRVN